MPLLKLEPFSGISGDMFLGALAPLLNAESEIQELPHRLGLHNVAVHFEDVIRSSLRCRRAVVSVEGHAPEAHHHDDHHHDHDHHHHDHDHHDHDHHHDHAHRAYRDIVHLIEHAELPAGVKARALHMFRLLGEAEAEMHGIPLEKVYFHEVGGEDAIVDIVGAALLLDKLNPAQVFCTPVCTGSGFVKTAHGRLPIPAPATQRLLEGMPSFPGSVAKEMCTPTGAVILAALQPVFEIPVLISLRSGFGAGSRDLHEQPNALRASLCSPATQSETISLLQTNLDTCDGEMLGADFLGDLLEQGALDAWISPILMKKGRPAQQLEILCTPARADPLSTFVLQQLPTLGVRRFDGNRRVLERRESFVDTVFGVIAVKVHQLPDGSERILPEYEACRRAALRHGVSLAQVRNVAAEALCHRPG